MSVGIYASRDRARKQARAAYEAAILDVEAEIIWFLRHHEQHEPGWWRRLSALRERLCQLHRAVTFYGRPRNGFAERRDAHRMGRATFDALVERYRRGLPIALTAHHVVP